MAEPHVISALTKKRSELLGDIKHYEALIREHKENLSTIDKAIHIFDTSYDLRTIKPKRVLKERYFKSGEAVVLLLDALRELKRPTKTDELAEIIATVKKLKLESDYEKATFQKAIVASLSRAVDNGLVEKVGRDGVAMVWQIKSPIKLGLK
jgi:hypothetical protein